jgi:hypothetical protein
MPRQKYKVEYFPIVGRDLAAPQAANSLLEKIEQAIQALDTFTYAQRVSSSPA